MSSWRWAPFLQNSVDFRPKIRQQAHSVDVFIKANPLPPMLVVIFDPRPSSRPRTFADGMGVVETQKALTVTVVQSQGVVQPMRLLRCRWNLFNLELDPEAVLHDER